MFDGPIRGGTRGGQGEFKWSDVSADKDRENYLGHSINAPTGRWQKNKDVHWYNRDLKEGEAERLEEIRKVKEAEADALAVALGFQPAAKPAPGSEAGPSTADGDGKKALEDSAALTAKEEKRRRKEERRKRKEEKRERKELRRLRKGDRDSVKLEADSDEDNFEDRRRREEFDGRRRLRSRSRSPKRIQARSVSRTPSYDGGGRRSRGYLDGAKRRRDEGQYDDDRRELERVKDRRRWEESNARRDRPGDRW